MLLRTESLPGSKPGTLSKRLKSNLTGGFMGRNNARLLKAIEAERLKDLRELLEKYEISDQDKGGYSKALRQHLEDQGHNTSPLMMARVDITREGMRVREGLLLTSGIEAEKGAWEQSGVRKAIENRVLVYYTVISDAQKTKTIPYILGALEFSPADNGALDEVFAENFALIQNTPILNNSIGGLIHTKPHGQNTKKKKAQRSAYLRDSFVSECINDFIKSPEFKAPTVEAVVGFGNLLRGMSTEKFYKQLGLNTPKGSKGKGSRGHMMERLIGTRFNSRPKPDLADGDLKTLGLKEDISGKLLPSEHLCLGMMNLSELRHKSFVESNVFRKCQKLALVPFIKDKAGEYFGEAVERNPWSEPDILCAAIKDWETLKRKLFRGGEGALSSKDTETLIAKTKGRGQPKAGSRKAPALKTRAYYLGQKVVGRMLTQKAPKLLVK